MTADLGRLRGVLEGELAAGCAESTSLETAELIVINTCSIREKSQEKVYLKPM